MNALIKYFGMKKSILSQSVNLEQNLKYKKKIQEKKFWTKFKKAEKNYVLNKRYKILNKLR